MVQHSPTSPRSPPDGAAQGSPSAADRLEGHQDDAGSHRGQLEVGGFGPDAFGGTRCGFTATTTINRRDYGVDFNAAMETGGVVVGDKITVQLEIEAVLDTAG